MSATATKMYWIGSSRKLEPSKKAELEMGQIIWLNGYGQSKHSHDRKVVFKQETTSFGVMYHAVNIDQEPPVISRHEAFTIRPEDQIFGIGIYYTPGDMFQGSKEELDQLVKAALDHERQERERREAEQRRMKEEEEAGKKVWEEMQKDGAVSLIVAELKEDRSDLMTDYFASVTVRTVILGPSKHNRNNFKELRKLAATSNIPDIAELATAPAEYEHRENYSMGAGYYLGKNRNSGWQIRKTPPYCDHLRELGKIAYDG
ncbi:MAG: fusion protein [Chlorobiaceae bacterium]|nr:fusion protein [Chlorobiaceae bacterium]